MSLDLGPHKADPRRDPERYERLELIATGGMGEVWRARDTVLDREVALKLLKPEYAEDPGFRERFVVEARNAALLLHPGIAAVFDFGNPSKVGDTGTAPRPFLVMELVDGGPLSELLAEGALDPDRARGLVAQAAEALAVAHQAGLVHRDVKPANLLVCTGPDGFEQIKVTDFGIARAVDAAPLTQTGQIIGTPQYLSPEQAEGATATAASDVYALGVVLFECLTGRRPFSADTPVGVALAHLQQPVPELPDDVPIDLAAITRRALAKDPAQRYPDAGALAAALRTGVADPTGDAPTRVLTGIMPAAVGLATSSVATTIIQPRTRRRLADLIPPWWPLGTMGALGVALLVALVLTGSGPAQTAGGAPETTQRAAVKVRVPATAYVGKPVVQVQDALRRLGVRSTIADHRRNPGGHVKDTVAALSPTGSVDKGRLIRLTVWAAPPPPTDHQAKPPPHAKKSPGKGPSKNHGKKHGKGH